MIRRERVAVLYGGVSGEHEVSIKSGQAVAAALVEAGYPVVRIYIDREGRWWLANEGERVILEQGGRLFGINHDRLVELGHVQMVFPVLHGTLGEDGTVQGLLEVLEVPYVGSGVLGSAVGMDKIIMKRLFRQAGIPTVDFVAATRRELSQSPGSIVAAVESKLCYPCFVKPANLGSSVGVSKAANRDELMAALTMAASYDRRLLVEKAVNAREIEVSVLGNDEPQASFPGEVIPGREFYDYIAKYGDAGSQILIPAPVGEEIAMRVKQMAVEAFLALDLAGMARVDFLLDRDSGDLFLNEVNTIPGFTNISMYAKLWEASGIGFAELATRLIGLAWERAEDRRLSRQAARQVQTAS